MVVLVRGAEHFTLRPLAMGKTIKSVFCHRGGEEDGESNLSGFPSVRRRQWITSVHRRPQAKQQVVRP